MIDHSTVPTGYGKNSSRNRIVFIAILVMSVILGPLWAQGMMPLEREIGFDSTTTKSIADGKYVIEYQTSGSELSNFSMSCRPNAYWDVLGPANNCIVIPYDGEIGVVQLKIPTPLVREFTDINEVQGGFYKQLAFQRISEDEEYTIIRIELPAGESPLKIIGTQSGRADLGHYVFRAVMASTWVFGGLLIAWFGSIAIAEKLNKRITKLRVR